MKKLLVVSSLAAMVVFAASLGMANPRGQGYGPGPDYGAAYGAGCGHGRMMTELWGGKKLPNLSPEQKAKFDELRRKFRTENAQLLGALVTKRIELQSLWTDPKADGNAILEKEKELMALQNQIREKAVQYRLEARKSLTPEQIIELGARWLKDQGWGWGRGHRLGPRQGMEFGPRGMHGPCW